MIEVFFAGCGAWYDFDGVGADPFPDPFPDPYSPPSHEPYPHEVKAIFTLDEGDALDYAHTNSLDRVRYLLPAPGDPNCDFTALYGPPTIDEEINPLRCFRFYIERRDVLLSLRKENDQIVPDLQKQTIHPTERQTMLKLIIGMAIDAYGFDPNSNRNAATGENNGSIKAALDLKGINIDADTIRKYLKEAAELLPTPTL